jgi:hypothetical protein
MNDHFFCKYITIMTFSYYKRYLQYKLISAILDGIKIRKIVMFWRVIKNWYGNYYKKKT